MQTDPQGDQSLNNIPEDVPQGERHLSPVQGEEPAVWIPEAPKGRDPLVASILLPRKDTVENATPRENAGALLAQEELAAEVGIPHAPAPAQKPLQPVAEKAHESPVVPNLQTYQSDIQSVVAGGNMSVVSIAAAEAARRSKTGRAAPEQKVSQQEVVKRSLKKVLMLLAGVVVVLGAVGTVAYVMLLPHSVGLLNAQKTPFIQVDGTSLVSVDPNASSGQAISILQKTRATTNISSGLVEQLLITVATSTGASPEVMPADEFLSTVAPNAPSALLRTLTPEFLFGIHAVIENQPFLLFHVDSYEQAFSAMLQWEGTLVHDLSPLLVPTTQKTSQSVTQATGTQQLLSTPFIDAVIANHDTRVAQDSTGSILLLWTFLDRNTLLITTNDATLREVISRQQTAPVIPTP